MANIFFRYRFQLLLMVIGLTWFTNVSSLLQLDLQNVIYPDSENYRESADFLYHHFQLHYYRPMVMAAVSGIPYAFGFSDANVFDFSYGVNLLSWLGTSLLLFSLLKQFLIEIKAFYITLTFFLLIGCITPVYHLLTESLYTFAIMAGFYLLSKYWQERNFLFLSVALCVFLIAVLIRPGIQYFTLLLVLYFSPMLIRNWNKRPMLCLIAGLAFIGIQMAGMKKQYGDCIVSYISGVTHYNYLGAKAESFETGKPLKTIQQQRMDSIFALPYHEQQIKGMSDLKNEVRHDPSDLVKAYFSDLAANSRTPSDAVEMCQNVSGNRHFSTYKTTALFITKWQNRLLTFSGILLFMYFLFGFRKYPFYSIVGLYILYTFLLSGFSFAQGDRFHIVFFPMVLLLAAKFATTIQFKNKKAA